MPRGENHPSILLSQDENQQVFNLIGPKCQSLATAVVQLFTTEGPAHNVWKKKDTGVLCLIKDNGRRSYFFRIYCLYRKTMIWEHEVYTQIEYKSPRPYLHTFEAEDYMTAFNFANEDEAKGLRNILIEKIEFRKQRREERRRSMLAARENANSNATRLNNSKRPNGSVTPTPANAPPPPPPPVPINKNSISGNYPVKNMGKKPKARKLTKADIGVPHDFKHVSHVGWDAIKGFDVDVGQEEEMRTFFNKVGISDTQLQDKETMQFVYDFINKNGGFNAVKEELHEAKPSSKAAAVGPPPPVPTRAPPSLPPGPPPRVPPPPPSRSPPSPLQERRAAPPPRPTQPPSSAPPPPPPPPPPLSPSPSLPSLPSIAPSPSLPQPTDARSQLMESIRSGNRNLKHVEVGSRSSLNDDNRSNLLSEIRQGIELKAVSRETSNVAAERRPSPVGLAGALARALQERSRAIHSSDSELSDATTSEGEWED